MLSRARAGVIVESRAFQGTVLAVIIINAVAVGLETSPAMLDRLGPLLSVIELAVIVIFIGELSFRFYAQGFKFFRDPWNWFDLFIVVIALVPAVSHLRVLRVVRVLQLARLISILPSLRRIVAATVRAIPNITTVIAMLGVALYSGAVVGTHIFRDVPQYFGDLGTSLFTMFEIMTIEAWPDVAEAVMARHPTGWVFFVAYLVIVGFILVNLLIGVIVSAMEFEVNRDHWEEDKDIEATQHQAVMDKLTQIEERLGRLEADRDGR